MVIVQFKFSSHEFCMYALSAGTIVIIKLSQVLLNDALHMVPVCMCIVNSLFSGSNVKTVLSFCFLIT